MSDMQPPDDRRSAAGSQLRTVQGQPIVPSRSLDEEAAFAARRAQYLQELRRAIAEVKRSYAVRVASNSDTPAAAATR